MNAFEARADNDLTDLPMAVIVDRTTAGAAEIIAAAILDNQRGDVIGERTVFGMGSEQELFPMDDGSALLLTTARYAAPSGKIFMVEGVTPNVEVKRPDLAEVAGQQGQDDAAAGGATPPVVVAPKPSDDVMLKKAVESLTKRKGAQR